MMHERMSAPASGGGAVSVRLLHGDQGGFLLNSGKICLVDGDINASALPLPHAVREGGMVHVRSSRPLAPTDEDPPPLVVVRAPSQHTFCLRVREGEGKVWCAAHTIVCCSFRMQMAEERGTNFVRLSAPWRGEEWAVLHAGRPPFRCEVGGGRANRPPPTVRGESLVAFEGRSLTLAQSHQPRVRGGGGVDFCDLVLSSPGVAWLA